MFVRGLFVRVVGGFGRIKKFCYCFFVFDGFSWFVCFVVEKFRLC